MAYFYENGWRRLRIGDAVHEVEGRHVGRVEAIINSATVKIKWDDTGWISFVSLADIVKANPDVTVEFVFDRSPTFAKWKV